jgi:hypothetical protein
MGRSRTLVRILACSKVPTAPAKLVNLNPPDPWAPITELAFVKVMPARKSPAAVVGEPVKVTSVSVNVVPAAGGAKTA